MNWTFHYSTSQNYVKIICEGRFTPEKFLVMKEELLRQPFWRPGLNILVDYRKTKLDKLKLKDLRVLAEKMVAENERVGGGKIGFLMNSTRDYGIARQYELITEASLFSEIMVFREEEEAIGWLNSDR